MRSLFFVPVYNQILEFPLVLEELRSTILPCTTILLVNNGSNDGSEALIRSSGFDYLDLPQNRGVGYSFMCALEWALKKDYQIFGSMAGNGKMLPDEMGQVLNPILADEADYVTGSRFLKGGNYPNLPGFRRYAIPCVNIFVKFLTGKSLSDATCGYRAMRTDIFSRAQFDWKHRSLETYGFEYYLYCKVLRDRHIRWKEVPVTMRYPAKGQRYSKIKPFKGWYEMLKPWVQATFDGYGFKAEDKSQ